MRWVGLTGGIATGKSTVAKLFIGRGVPVIDADQLAHQAVAYGSEGLSQVVQSFGPEVLDAQNRLNRRVLGQIVFNDPSKLKALENILHPLIKVEVQNLKQQLESQGHLFAIYDVPLLFEKKMQQQFDQIIVVGCDSKTQLSRLMKRNHLSQEEAQSRILSQLPLEEKKLQAHWYLNNSGSLDLLQAQFDELYRNLQSGQLGFKGQSGKQ